MIFDKRITAIRNDIASDDFKGLIKRKKFVHGKKHNVIAVYSPLYSLKNSKLSTQLLYGEECSVFDSSKGWSWVQSLRDGYVGYTPSKNLKKIKYNPTHKVTALRTFIYHVFIAQTLNVVVRATMIFGGIAAFLIVFFYLALAL